MKDRHIPEAAADANGLRRPGLPAVQSGPRVKQDSHMEAELGHNCKMGSSAQAFNMAAGVLWRLGAKLPINLAIVWATYHRRHLRPASD